MRWGLISRLSWCEMRDEGNTQLTSCDRIQHNRYIKNIWSTRTRCDPAQYKLDSQETQLTHLPREQKCEIERKHGRCHRVQTVVLNDKTSLCSLLSSQTRLRLIGQPEVTLGNMISCSLSLDPWTESNVKRRTNNIPFLHVAFRFWISTKRNHPHEDQYQDTVEPISAQHEWTSRWTCRLHDA